MHTDRRLNILFDREFFAGRGALLLNSKVAIESGVREQN